MKKYFIIMSIITIVLIIVNIFIWNDNLVIEENVEVKTTKFYTGQVGESDLDTVWCGTFQLAWNELINHVGGKIEFVEEDMSSATLETLNKQNFTKEMLSEEDYYIKTGKVSLDLKQEILRDIDEKFGKTDSTILNKMNFENSNGIAIYTRLNKEFEFLEEFDEFGFGEFYENDETIHKIKYFGVKKKNYNKLAKNIEVMCYEKFDDEYRTIVKLKTKAEDEIILYKRFKFKTTQNPVEYEYKTFEELYQDVIKYSNLYEGSKELLEDDVIKIPNINMNIAVNYDELCGKEIKGTNGEYISDALQTIGFLLDAKGGKVKSEAGILTDTLSAAPTTAKYLEFDRPFVIFIKEKNAEKPYFAARINNEEFLEKEIVEQ